MKKKKQSDSIRKEMIISYCKNNGYPIPIKEHKFHVAGVIFDKKRLWRLDLCWEEEKLALEIHGGVFIKGRHVTGIGMTKDCEKFSCLAVQGYRLIQVTTGQVDSGFVFKVLDHEFNK
jgi:hypothetical protein